VLGATSVTSVMSLGLVGPVIRCMRAGV
jgi:hypothetical protein